MKRHPTYLRIVAIATCNMSCSYCHMEGDPLQRGTPPGLEPALLAECLRVAARVGMMKYKFLGGEPFLRGDLPELVGVVRQACPPADISAITAGAVPIERLDAVLAAGMDRVNVTIHGFGETAFAERSPRPILRQRRNAFVEAVLAHGRPVKLNFVYRGSRDLDDLAALLSWAAERRLLVNLLDDLGSDVGFNGVRRAAADIRGQPDREYEFPDPHSLPTIRWAYADGLVVELKHQRLGEQAPYRACATCPARARCKEGIYALRLTHRGMLQPCMDRADLALDLAGIVRERGPDAAQRAWRTWMQTL